MADRHNRTRYLAGCRCQQCKQAQSAYLKAYRRRKRAETVGLAAVAPSPVSVDVPPVDISPGRVVIGVQAEIAALGEHGRPGLAAVAIAMAELLDRQDALPQQPAAARQLTAVLNLLRQRPVQRGKLAAVKQMSRSSRGGSPDAG